MAKRIITRIIDDLDGGDAAETVPFALDGMSYEIDLSVANAKRLRTVLEPFVVAGTRVGRGGIMAARTPAPRRRGGLTDREQNAAIRAWAKREGKEISDRGRIPQTIVDEYQGKAGR